MNAPKLQSRERLPFRSLTPVQSPLENFWRPKVGRLFTLLITLAALVQSAIAADPLSNWTTRVSPYGTTNNWKAITYGNGRFVAVSSSAGLVITSTNGTHWEARSANTNKAFYGVAFGDGKFVAAGASGLVMTSTDGVQWHPRTSGTTTHLYSVGFHNGRFVISGASGLVLHSTTGTSWTPQSTGSSNQWRGSAFGNNTHVIVGYRSQSGTSYTRSAAASALGSLQAVDTGSTLYLSRVAFGGGKFVACGYAGQTQTSTDGLNWTPVVNAGSTWLFDIAFNNGVFVAVGELGKVTTSTNGVNWTSRRSASGQSFNGVAFGNNTWVAVGDDGLIVQSDPFIENSDSIINLSHAYRSGTQFSFRFNGVAGQTYHVQASTNLVHWQTVTTLLCTNSIMNCNLAGQTDPRRFYRVIKP